MYYVISTPYGLNTSPVIHRRFTRSRKSAAKAYAELLRKQFLARRRCTSPLFREDARYHDDLIDAVSVVTVSYSKTHYKRWVFDANGSESIYDYARKLEQA